MVQWLRPHTSSAGDTGSIPGWGTKIPHATQHGQKKSLSETIFFEHINFDEMTS